MASPTTQVLREVMRLEEALAAVSKGISDRIAAGTPGTALEVEADPHPIESASADAREGLLLPSSTDERAGDVAPPSRQVARLEDVLKISSPAPTIVSVPPPAAPTLDDTAVEAEAALVEELTSIAPPTYVAAQALREAFWFEQAAAFIGTPAAFIGTPATPQAPAPVESPQVETEAPSQAQPEPEHQPEAESDGWVTAIFLLTLLALVMLLTGRRPRR